MSVKDDIEEANNEVLDRLSAGQPVWEDVATAEEVIPGMKGRIILHSGPPISWEGMAQAQKNAVLGAVVYEGWATDLDSAAEIVENGEVTLEPCHHHDTVGSMIGVTSPSMPVHVVRNRTHNYTAYCLVYEGAPGGMPRNRLAFGSNDGDVIANLRWIEKTLAPALGQAVRAAEGIPLKPIMARALGMGDELHSRTTAASAITALQLASHLNQHIDDVQTIREVWGYLSNVELYFLPLSMAACKSIAEPAHEVERSTVVLILCRNGVEYGIQISGLGRTWYTGPAQLIDGLYFSGFGLEDSCPDVGDSAITEAMGLGASAMAAAPALVQFKGGQMASALESVRRIGEITISRHSEFLLPVLDNEGTPFGIDIRRVVDTGITPLCDTGIAHKDGGQIGFGTSSAPIEPFEKAIKGFSERYLS